ncbi:MAG: hypothetical protein WCT07_04330 [Candidatus Paceibacterota bacterium]|jgi:hypothetical protein
MQLTEKDIESPLWKKLEAHFNESLERFRRDLEKQSISNEKTFSLRGKIELTRQHLKLGDRQNIIGQEQTDDTYR